jgi:hypothetical protein
MSLVDANGNELTTKKRRRKSSYLKKTTPYGDVLFRLIVDMPEVIGEDDFNRVMVEFFNIGSESFRNKLR